MGNHMTGDGGGAAAGSRGNARRNIWWVANGLFAVAVLLFIAGKVWGNEWVVAFAEAAMVGALADWFAVVALFRKPLGIPWHTAVIPRRKDEIGKSLGEFVADNFLVRAVVEEKLRKLDLAGKASGWLRDNAEAAAGRVSEWVPELLATLDEEEIRGLIQRELRGRVEAMDLAGLTASMLETLTADGRHRELLVKILGSAREWLADNKGIVRGEVEKSLPLADLEKIPLVGPKVEGLRGIVSAVVADFFVAKIQSMLEAVRSDASHPIRAEYEQAVASLIADLRESPARRAKVEEIKRAILASDEVGGYLGSVWDEIKRKITDDLSKPDSGIARAVRDGLRRAADAMDNEDGLKPRLDAWLKKQVADLAEAHRRDAARMIEETVKSWDGPTLAKKLEEETGEDLQYIRLNGTLLGGLIGLVIHAVSLLFP